MDIASSVTVNTIADLKLRPVDTDALCLVVGATTVGDGKGGFYQWQATSTAIDDTTGTMPLFNTIVSSVSTTGRWIRLWTRNKTLAQGTLVQLGAFRWLFASGTVSATSDILLNLTDDNTATGTALFSTLKYWHAEGMAPQTAVTDRISFRVKAIDSALKTITFGFDKPSATTVLNLTLVTAGMSISPTQNVTAGTTVQVMVAGMI